MKGTYLEAGRDDMQRETIMNMYNADFILQEISTATKLSIDEINSIITNTIEGK